MAACSSGDTNTCSSVARSPKPSGSTDVGRGVMAAGATASARYTDDLKSQFDSVNTEASTAVIGQNPSAMTKGKERKGKGRV